MATGGFWQCSICTFAENPGSYLACDICGEVRGSAQSTGNDFSSNQSPASEKKRKERHSECWTCETCTFNENSKEILCCACCGTQRATAGEVDLVDEDAEPDVFLSGEESTSQIECLLTQVASHVPDQSVAQRIQIRDFDSILRHIKHPNSQTTNTTSFWVLYRLGKGSKVLRDEIISQGGLPMALRNFKDSDPRKSYETKTLAALLVACLIPSIPGKTMYQIQADVKECEEYLLSQCAEPIKVNGQEIGVDEMKRMGEFRGRQQIQQQLGGSNLDFKQSPMQMDPSELRATIDVMAQRKDATGLFAWLASKSSCRPMVNIQEREILYVVLENLITFAETDKSLRAEMIVLGVKVTVGPLMTTAENAADWSKFPQRDQALVILLVAYLLCSRDSVLGSLSGSKKQDYKQRILLWLEQLDEYSDSPKTMPQGFPPQLRYISGAARIYLDAHTSAQTSADDNRKTLALIHRHMGTKDATEIMNLLCHHSALRIQHPSLLLEILVSLLKQFDTDKAFRDEMIGLGMAAVFLQIFYAAPLNSVEVRTISAMIIVYLLRSDQLLATSDEIQMAGIRDCVDYLCNAKRSVVVNHATEADFSGAQDRGGTTSAKIHLALSFSKIVHAGEEARAIVARGPVREAFVVMNGDANSNADMIDALHVEATSNPENEKWTCRECTYAKNHPSAEQCEFCGCPNSGVSNDAIDLTALASQMSAVEVGELVVNQDVFGLLCVVNRATEPDHKMVVGRDPLIKNPLDTALALMVFARDGSNLRDAMISNGALSVFTKIFKDAHKSHVSSQLRTLAALTVAYLVPAANEKALTDLNIEVEKCMQFLRLCNLGINVNGVDITREELQLAGESRGAKRLSEDAKIAAIETTQVSQKISAARDLNDIAGVLEDLASFHNDRSTQLTLLVALMNKADGQPQARDQMITLDAFEVLQQVFNHADKSDLETKTVISLTVAYLLRSCYPRKFPLTPTKRIALVECLDFLKSSKTSSTINGIALQRDERNLLYLSNQARNYFTLLDSQEMREKRSRTIENRTKAPLDVAVPSLKRGRSVLGGAIDIESSVFHLGSNDMDRKLDAVSALLKFAKESPTKRALMHNYGVVTRLIDVIRIGKNVNTPLNVLAALTVAYILLSLDESILQSSKNEIDECLKVLDLHGSGAIQVKEVEMSSQEVMWATEILQQASYIGAEDDDAKMPARASAIHKESYTEDFDRGRDINMILKLQSLQEEDSRLQYGTDELPERLSVDLDFEELYKAKETQPFLELLRTGSCRMLDAALLLLAMINQDKNVAKDVAKRGGIGVLLRIFSHWAGTSGELRMTVAMVVDRVAPFATNTDRASRISDCVQFVQNNNAKAQLINIRAANKVNSFSKFKLEATTYNCTSQDGFVGIITLNSLGIMVEAKSWLWSEIKDCVVDENIPRLVRLSTNEPGAADVVFELNEKEARRLEEDILGRLKAYQPGNDIPQDLPSSVKPPKVLDISYADRPEFLGVSVYHLENFFLPEVQAQEGLRASSKFYEIENLNEETGFVRKKGQSRICPLDGRLGAAYVHCLEGDDHVGLANHMLSWTWSYSVRDVVETLVGFCEANNYDPKRTYVWICCLCLNQHRVVESNNSGIGSVSAVDFENEFQRRVVGIGRVLVLMTPWGDPANLKRVWCIFEAFMALTSNCELSIVMPPRERDRMAAQLFSSFGRGRTVDYGIDSLYKALNNVDLEKAQASVEQDRERIHDLIRERIGFQAVNLLVRDRLRRWVRHVIDQLVQERAQHEQQSESEEKNENTSMDNTAKLSYCTFLKQVGDIYDLYGDFPAAHEMYKKCCDLRQAVLGFDSLDVAEAYTDLGRTLFVHGAYDLSMDMYINALKIQEKLLAKNHLDTARTYFHVGRLLQEMGEVDDSMQMMQKCLAVQEEVLGKHRETAVTYTYVGLLLSESNREDGFEKGFQTVQKAQSILEESVGEAHPDTAFCYSALATLLQKSNRFAEALSWIEKCCSIQESVLGDRHPSLAKSLVTMGEIMTRQAKLEESLQVFRQALDIYESSTGANHIPIARAYAYMSVTASHLKRYREAREAHENVMRTLEKAPGSLDQDLVLIYSSAGEELYEKGNHEIAVQIFRQGLAVMEAMLGSDHPDLAAGHDAVGLTLYSKGEYRLALEEYKRSMEIKKATLPEDSPEVVEMTQLIEGVTTQWLAHRRDSVASSSPGSMLGTLAPHLEEGEEEKYDH